MAKSWHKLFWAQFLFGTNVKTSYENVIKNTWIFDLSAKRSFQVLGPKQKWFDFPLNIFSIFYQFSGSFPCTIQHLKKLKGRFSVSARFGTFWILANYQKINRKLKKYWGKIDSFLPWTQNLKWTLGPSFCTQVKKLCVV